MNPRLILALLMVLSAAPGCNPAGTTSAKADSAGGAARELLYFFDPHCPDCKEIEASHLEVLAARSGFLPEEIQRIDVTALDGAQALLAAQARYGFACDVLAPVLVIRGKGICGVQEIRAEADPSRGGGPLAR